MSETFKNSYIAKDREMMSLSVYNVGYQRCAPRYQWGPGIRDHYLIHSVVSGKGYYEFNHQCYEIGTGDTFLIYPYTEVTYYADKDEPWEYYWVGFFGSDASSILNATDFSSETPVIHESNMDEQLIEQILKIYSSRGSGLMHTTEMTGYLYLALAQLIKNSTPEFAANTSSHTYVQKAINYISHQYSYPITIDEIANYTGISRSHLYRAFKEHLSKSPKEYLTEFRIRQACSLLKHSDLSIASIAASTGFENNLYFSKVFSKIKGISPSSYKKTIAETD